MFASSGQGFQTEAVVKWFSLPKGFGFVAPVDGSRDAFMHSSVVSRAGLRDVAEGTKLLVQIGDGPKGRQVLSIVSVLGMSEGGGQSDRGDRGERNGSHGGGHGDGHFGGGYGGQGGGRPAPTGPESEINGTVKWFKPDKGFGFVTPDDGDRDIFVHRSVVMRAGLQMLDTGQRLRMKVQSAAKGREATEIEVI
jgi:CspA family cold shock protein